MQDRTPTIERLEFLVQSLDDVVRNIYSHVHVTTLKHEEIIAVMTYMGRNFSTRDWGVARHHVAYKPIRKYNLKGQAVFHDMAYRLMKDKIAREIDLPDDQKRLLFDGVMGWLWYTPGTAHGILMKLRLREYAAAYGVESLNGYFPIIRDKFNDLGQIATLAEGRLIKAAAKPQELAYLTMFTQMFAYSRSSHFDIRQEKIAEVITGFNPV